MKEDARQVVLWCVLAVAIAICGLWGLGEIFRSGEPNAELARTTREALEMAREAGEDAEDTRRAAGALRLAALAVGVATPLLVAYLIYRLQARQETSVEEVLRVLEREGLLGDGLDVRKALPGRKRLLTERKDGRGGGGPG